MNEPKPFMITMLVIDPSTDKIIRKHEVNFKRSNSKRWMEKALVWAFNNDLIVELSSEATAKKYGLSEDFVLTDTLN